MDSDPRGPEDGELPVTAPTLQPHAYVLAVHDLAGFAKDWNDGGDWQAVIRDGVRIMLGRYGCAAGAELGDHSYFAFAGTDDVDALHAEFAARSAHILAEPADKPWGRRAMPVATPEGHRIMFARWIG